MNARHLHPVEPASRPTRARTREEIVAWIAERRLVLTELLAREQRQLNLEDLERRAA
jgi:predicted Fe-S protein YdhL (DUF1289 family)